MVECLLSVVAGAHRVVCYLKPVQVGFVCVCVALFIQNEKRMRSIIQNVYKLSEDFAKPYFHKYWTEIHDITTIWKRNVCSFIVTLNAFDVRPQSGTSHKICLRGFGGNGSIAWTSAVSQMGRTSNAFKVTMKLQTFLFQMVVTSCISARYLWKYGFAKSSDNLYALCIWLKNIFVACDMLDTFAAGMLLHMLLYKQYYYFQLSTMI